jgi:class 3 adenylate cyclase/tetratricopeptide (TPR) repeat protein
VATGPNFFDSNKGTAMGALAGYDGIANSETDSASIEISTVSPLVAGIILANAQRKAEDFAVALPAIVLCADIAGFSIAGAALTRSEERGAEELRSIVSSVFDRVSDAIRAAGGQILQFSGDAVTAAWPCRSEVPSQIVCAIAAGLAVQDACRTLSVAGMVGLKLRVSMGEGPIWIAHLAGDAQIPQIVICGEVFRLFRDRTGSAEGVFLDDALWNRVPTDLHGPTAVVSEAGGVRVLGLDGVRPTPDPVPSFTPYQAKIIAGYVPGYLGDLLQGTLTDWLAEFRSSSILFARFEGFGFSGTADLPRLQALAKGIAQAIDQNGGLRLKFATDDKGLVLMAAWGLQSRSFEDNAERALAAAALVHQAAQDANLEASIGVTGGKVFAGLVGSDGHREYTVIGDAVNRAAALSSRARGQTRVDEQTRDSGARRYQFSEAGVLHLKGQDAAAHYVVTGERLRQAVQHGEMVGRAAERGQVDELVAQVGQRKAPGIVHIVGDAGLGKSRLAGYLQSCLETAGIPALRMNADSLRRTTGFYPWRQLLSAMAGADLQVDDLQKLLDADPALTELLPLLSPVLQAEIPDNATTASLFGGGRAEKTQTVIIALLERLIATRAQALIVEDAHWFDSASWQLLERFARAFPHVTVIVVSRPLDPDALPFEARRLLDRPDKLVIQLGPFSRDGSVALINAALGVIEAAPSIANLIFSHAEGHPLFTKALALSLRDRGLLRVEAGYAHLGLGDRSLSQIAFPDGVEGVVAERIASLTLAQQLTLKIAAVLGRSFDVEMLARLHPGAISSDALATEIAAAERAGLVESVDATQGRHRFHHAIIGDTAYKLLVSDQRRNLHAKAADLMNARESAEGYPAASLALLAHHYEQAHLHELAVDFLSRAAQSARSGYNNAEVVDLLTRALKIADGKPQLADSVTRGHWNHMIADALKALGHYQRASDFLYESARLLDRAPPRSTRGALVRALGGYARYRLRPHRAPRPAKERDPMIAAAEINMTLSEIHYELNKVPFSLAEVLRGVNLARNAGGDSTSLAKIYMGMALISRALPKALDGNDLQEKSIAMAERIGDLPTISWVYMASGVFEMGKCGWQTGETHFRRSMQVAEQCGERKNWETSMSSLGNLKRVEGLFEEAKACSDATLAAARDRDISHSIAWSHNGRLRDLMCLNRLEEAREDCRILHGILNDPRKRGDTNDNSNVVDGYARCLLGLVDGDLGLARKGLDDAIAVVRGMSRPQVYMVQNVSFLCDAVWNLWQRTGDRSLLAQSAVVAKSGARMAKQYRAGTPSAELAAGDAAWYRGKRAVAARHWRTSAEAAGQRGMLYNQAQALFRLDEADCKPADRDGPSWQAILTQLGIQRPRIWSIATA